MQNLIEVKNIPYNSSIAAITNNYPEISWQAHLPNQAELQYRDEIIEVLQAIFRLASLA